MASRQARRLDTLDHDEGRSLRRRARAAWQSLRESILPRHVDHGLPPVDAAAPRFPRLTPAGVLPPADEDEALEREHV